MSDKKNIAKKVLSLEEILAARTEWRLEYESLLENKFSPKESEDFVMALYNKEATIFDSPLYKELRAVKDEMIRQAEYPQAQSIAKSDKACRNCGSTSSIQYQKQTRSADEEATSFIMCNDCGKESRV